MKNFEQRLERLEALGEKIRDTDIPLDEALSAFEEGIKLSRSLETDLEKIEGRIEILMNGADEKADADDPASKPDLDLFNTHQGS
jgi:exodeoxyribonuclease VII small subunit